MFWFLIIGIALIAFPLLGFLICGAYMMFGTLKDDPDGGKIVTTIMTLMLIGLSLIVVSLVTSFLKTRL